MTVEMTVLVVEYEIEELGEDEVGKLDMEEIEHILCVLVTVTSWPFEDHATDAPSRS
jgi:hypothetical protein